MRIHSSIETLVGGTPLVRLAGVCRKTGITAALTAKLESHNPAGSAKDRIAREMIRTAEESGTLKPGAAIIEPTSGNTGIGLAAIGAARGYRVILTMPDTMSRERIDLLRAYGAQVILTPGKDGMTGAIAKAEELHASIPGSIIAGQFDNPANPAAHYKTTGPEIWKDTDGTVDIFVAGVGTGGTLSGTGRYLKEQNPAIQIIAVEPYDSPLLSGGSAGPHKLQGIGANFIPANLDREIYDEVITVKTEEAFAAAKLLAHNDGILAGISSGAALHAAMTVASRPENADKTIVVLLPDTGDRYLSTGLFDD
ncbi:MAG: cysteine synthase A [Ruminococcaceae bacterium]|nr:cysteine synthase A [Oscillospiraceae bacterium]